MSNTTGAKATAQQQRPAIIVLIIAFSLLLVLAVVLIISWARADANASSTSTPGGDVPATASATPPPVAGCTESEQVTFIAYQAPAGSNNFGPDVPESSMADLFKALREAACNDPLFFATLKLFAEKGENFTPEEAQALAQSYKDNRAQWKGDYDAFFANVSQWRVANDPNSYRTLGMVVGSDPLQMPTLVKSDQDVPVGQALFFTAKDAEGNVVERELRVFCHFQPVAHDFPAIQPPKPPAPAPQPEQPQPEQPCADCGGSGQPECTENCGGGPCVENCGGGECITDCQPCTDCLTPKDPSKDPQAQGNVPREYTRTQPEVDNQSEVSRGNVAPVDQGNGIPQGATSGPAAPRSTPQPAPTQVQGTTVLPAPTQAPVTAAPVSSAPTADGSIAPPGP